VTLEERVLDEPEWAAREIVWLRAERDAIQREMHDLQAACIAKNDQIGSLTEDLAGSREELADLKRWDESFHERKRQLLWAEARGFRRALRHCSQRAKDARASQRLWTGLSVVTEKAGLIADTYEEVQWWCEAEADRLERGEDPA